MQSDDGRRRVAIEGVRPEIDAGRFPIKRTIGERVVVEADAFTDGHDEIAVVLRHHHEDEPRPSPVEPEGDVAADVKWQEYDREQGCDGQCVGLHWCPWGGWWVASYGCPIRGPFGWVSALRTDGSGAHLSPKPLFPALVSGFIRV